jgi:hypothetical protein
MVAQRANQMAASMVKWTALYLVELKVEKMDVLKVEQMVGKMVDS